MMKKKRFVINDETIENCYGFHVLTAGIELADFKANPVCLHDHRNTTKHVLGAWTDLKVQNGKLLGSPNFDTEDPEGKEVVRKVRNGTIKACSMGIFFNEKDMQLKGGKVVLEKCKLYEVSIVAVPANANAITLYNQNGEMISEDKVKSLCFSLQNSKQPHNKENMKTVKAHLQLGESADEKAVLNAVQGIEAKLSATAKERDDYKQKVADLEAQETARLKAKFEKETELAVKDGRLNADGKEAILSMAEGKYDKALKVLSAMPKQRSITDELEGEKKVLAAFDKMSWNELDKGDHLATLKTEHPNYYKERFVQEFGVEPKE